MPVRKANPIASLMVILLILSCNERTAVVAPLSLSENIPTFFFLQKSGTDLLQNSTEVSRYYNTLLEHAGRTDTLAAEFYRVEEYDESCRFRVELGGLDEQKRYCFPLVCGVHVLLFLNGDVGLYFVEPLGE